MPDRCAVLDCEDIPLPKGVDARLDSLMAVKFKGLQGGQLFKIANEALLSAVDINIGNDYSGNQAGPIQAHEQVAHATDGRGFVWLFLR